MINRTELENRQLEQETIIRKIMTIRSLESLRVIFRFAAVFDGAPIITEEREHKISDFVRTFEA